MMNKFLISLATVVALTFGGVAQADPSSTSHYHEFAPQIFSGIVCDTYEQTSSIVYVWEQDGYDAAKARYDELRGDTRDSPEGACISAGNTGVFVEEILLRTRLVGGNDEVFIGIIMTLRSNTGKASYYALGSEGLPGEGA